MTTFFTGNQAGMTIATAVENYWVDGVADPVCFRHARVFSRDLRLQPAFEGKPCPFCTRESVFTMKQLKALADMTYHVPAPLSEKWNRAACEGYLSWEVAVAWHHMDNEEPIVNAAHELARKIRGTATNFPPFVDVIAPYYTEGHRSNAIRRYVHEEEGNNRVILTTAIGHIYGMVSRFIMRHVRDAFQAEREAGESCRKFTKAELDSMVSDWIQTYIFEV